MRLRNAKWARDDRPLEEGCDCQACLNYSRGAIRHFFTAKEMLGAILLTIHNLRFFFRLMQAIREAISRGDLQASARQWSASMYRELDDGLDSA